MPTEDALEAMQALAAETGLDLSDEALAASQPQVAEEPAATPEPEPQATPAAAQPAAPAQAATPAVQPAPQQQPQNDPQAAGILRAMLDEREKRQDAERRLREFEAAQKKEPAEMPDPFLDPNGFADARAEAKIQAAIAPIQQQLQQAVLRSNVIEARATHGAELMQQAADEFDKASQTLDPLERARVMQAPNPYMAAVEWMKRRDALAEIGDDVSAYRQRLAEQLLQDPEFLGRASEAARSFAAGNPGVQPASQPQAQPRTPAGQFASAPKPPSLPSVNRAGSGAGSAPIKAPPQTDQEIVDEVISAKGRPAWA